MSLIDAGKLILSIFNRSQHFNNFLVILPRFLLPSSSLKTDTPTAYEKHLSSLFCGFIIAPLLANFVGVGTNPLTVGGFIS